MEDVHRGCVLCVNQSLKVISPWVAQNAAHFDTGADRSLLCEYCEIHMYQLKCLEVALIDVVHHS